mmetsp:Transcript_100812/g.289222  ORF Transcript_100812/g.289222 Transcript_100812/m.289222 type:complete len:648 (-) Transcript_100812:5464-7407(-)
MAGRARGRELLVDREEIEAGVLEVSNDLSGVAAELVLGERHQLLLVLLRGLDRGRRRRVDAEDHLVQHDHVLLVDAIVALVAHGLLNRRLVGALHERREAEARGLADPSDHGDRVLVLVVDVGALLEEHLANLGRERGAANELLVRHARSLHDLDDKVEEESGALEVALRETQVELVGVALHLEDGSDILNEVIRLLAPDHPLVAGQVLHLQVVALGPEADKLDEEGRDRVLLVDNQVERAVPAALRNLVELHADVLLRLAEEGGLLSLAEVLEDELLDVLVAAVAHEVAEAHRGLDELLLLALGDDRDDHGHAAILGELELVLVEGAVLVDVTLFRVVAFREEEDLRHDLAHKDVDADGVVAGEDLLVNVHGHVREHALEEVLFGHRVGAAVGLGALVASLELLLPLGRLLGGLLDGKEGLDHLLYLGLSGGVLAEAREVVRPHLLELLLAELLHLGRIVAAVGHLGDEREVLAALLLLAHEVARGRVAEKGRHGRAAALRLRLEVREEELTLEGTRPLGKLGVAKVVLGEDLHRDLLVRQVDLRVLADVEKVRDHLLHRGLARVGNRLLVVHVVDEGEHHRQEAALLRREEVLPVAELGEAKGELSVRVLVLGGPLDLLPVDVRHVLAVRRRLVVGRVVQDALGA